MTFHAKAVAAALDDPLPTFGGSSLLDYGSGVALNFTSHGGQLRPMPKLPKWTQTTARSGVDCETRQWELSRHKKKRPYLIPGAFSVWCAECPLGVVLMTHHEGPSTSTSALYTHLPETNRDMTVVCDNPCHVSEFARTRFPRFFRLIRYLCDRFHLWPHKCRVVTDMDEFPYLDKTQLRH